MNNLFAMATRKKFRYPFNGQISTEDLWDLSLENLDLIYKNLNKEKKNIHEESLLEVEKKDEVLEAKISIIKYVVDYKLAEQRARSQELENKRQKQLLLEVLESKKNEHLSKLSIEELEEKIKRLG